MKEFQLSCGAIVLLDDEDYERLPKTGWYLSKKEIHNPNTDYVVHDFYGKMHRWVLGLKQNDCSNLVVDHINQNGLDNRKENLRLVTTSINKRNVSSNTINILNYTGISLEINPKNRSYRFKVSWSEGESCICKDGKKRSKQKTKSFSFQPFDLNTVQQALKQSILFRNQKCRENDYILDERSTTIERIISENPNIDIEKILGINLHEIISSRVGSSESKKESLS